MSTAGIFRYGGNVRGIAAIAAVAVLTAGYGVSSGDASTGSGRHGAVASSAHLTENRLPRGVLSEIKVDRGSGPEGLVAGFGSVWVGAHRGNDVFRIDPKTDKVIARIDVGHEVCGQPVAGYGGVWVGPCDDSTKTSVIDPKTNQVIGSVDLYGADVFANGSVWGSANNLHQLLRINPKTLRVQAKLPVAGVEDAFDGHDIWAIPENESGAYTGVIREIDPVTNHILATIHTPRAAVGAYMVYAYGSLWIKGDSPTLLKINARTHAVASYRVPNDQVPDSMGDIWIANGNGSLWIRSGDGVISRINPTNGKAVGRYATDPNGDGGFPLVAFGSLWTANFDTDSVWRIRITT
jgi:streptogramin lyase